MHNSSVWSKDFEIPKRPQLKNNIETEIAVIGAGMAGILIAERLASKGRKVVILEAKRIAWGQTKNTTAKITAQHGAIYSNLISQLKTEGALQYAKANMRAVQWYKNTVKERNIECSFSEQKAYVYSYENQPKLKAEFEACEKLHLPVKFIENPSLPFKTVGAVCMECQAQFNPMPFIKNLSDNLEIYEHTPVTKVQDNTLFCGKYTVEASHIIFACHYPFINFPGLYFARMYQQRSYVLALANTPKIDGMYISAEQNGFSLRMAGDVLLLGGGQHRTGENTSGGKYELLYRTAQNLFPESKAVTQWSAQDCISADGIPYIGRYSEGKPNWYVATGFGKWGMTSSAVSAEIITDLIEGKENGAAKIFAPSRFSLKAAIGTADEVFHSAKGLIKQVVNIPKSKLEDIPVGNGGSIVLDGKRIDVYRESEEKYHSVSLKCPHLGCRLEWNQDEKSWDCPCHGSRFDYMGKLIDNPAQENIK